MSAQSLTHALALYESEDQFLDAAVPFCRQGVERGDPTVVRLAGPRAKLLRDELNGEADGLVFLSQDDAYPNAAGAMAMVLALLEAHPPGPDRRLRLLGQLPPLRGLSWDAWLRYEDAVSVRLRDLPIHGLCTYEAAAIPPELRADLLRSHDAVVSTGGKEAINPVYDPAERIPPRRAAPASDPLEEAAPQLVLQRARPAKGRAAVTALATEAGLTPEIIQALEVGVSEVLTNALLHGRLPVTLRAWSRPGRVLVSVNDAGKGPADPAVGLLPPASEDREGGRGLWIAHQLCPEIALSVDDDGFTVRFAAGSPTG